MFYLDPPLVPKDGRTLRLLVPVRVSDPNKQDERSLDDQRAKIEAWIRERTDLPFELTVLEGRGSGECLDRDEHLRLVELVTSRVYDGVVAEDLGRILRRMHAVIFCEHCVDHDTRLIAINDHVDTGKDGWEDASIFSAWHHQRSNRDTSQRIKRTHRNRFTQGGCVRNPAYGWVKPPGAKSDADLAKEPAAEPLYQEWFRMLDEDNASFADVASFLKQKGIKFPSRYRGKFVEPDGRSVARHTFNPMLKGVRERNRRKTKRINDPGKYVSFKAPPEDLLQRRVPHLAFFDEPYYDRVVAKVRARNSMYRRSDDPKSDPCLHRPRKQTRYPGRVTFCGICGRPFVWGGHGMTDHLMCTGAREHRCWNGATFNGPAAAKRIATAVMEQVESLEDFNSVFLQMLNEEGMRLDDDRERKLADYRKRLAEVDGVIANTLAFIGGGKAGPSVAEEMGRLDGEKARLKTELDFLTKQPTNTVEIPPAAEIKRLVATSLQDLATGSPEFARVLAKLVSRIVVFPVQLCNGGHVVLRARFRVHLANLLPDRRAAEMLRRPLEQMLTVDLYDPPQREQFRKQIVAARAAGKTEAIAAQECGITVTAAQRASALQRRMDELGITDPYAPVLEPPDDCPKLRRHRHSDYRFEPLPGAGQL